MKPLKKMLSPRMRLRLLAVKDFFSSFHGGKIADGTVLPGKYFRAAYKANTAKNKVRKQTQRALHVAAESLFGKQMIVGKESGVIQSVFYPYTSVGRIYSEVKQYVEKEKGNIETLKLIEKKVRVFSMQAANMADVKYAHSRHMITGITAENVDLLKKAIEEYEKDSAQ